MRRILSFCIILFAIVSLNGQNNLVTVEIRPGSEESMDGNISELFPDTKNNGDNPRLNVFTWTRGGILHVKRLLIAFNLDFVPPETIIQSAFLSLYYNPVDDVESFDFHSGSNEMYIERVIEPWIENSLSWSNKPATTAINRVGTEATSSGTQNFENIDVTQLIQDILDSQEGNHGMMLRMQNESNPYRALLLASGEHPDPSLHPKLVIEYISPPQENLIKVDNASVYIQGVEKGVIMTSSDGRCWKLEIDNSGQLRSYLIACPE